MLYKSLFKDRIPAGLAPAGVYVWRPAMARSVRRLNGTELPLSAILDVGGGAGWLAAMVNTGVSYTLLDPRPGSLRADVRVLRGTAENMPVAGNSIGLVMSVSVTQYLNHDAFFREARRVLAPNGVLALHENGCCNPIISVVRVAGRVASLWSASRRDYNRTIKAYLKADQCPPGFTLIYSDAAGLLSPIATLIGRLRVFGFDRALGRLLISFDDWALQWKWLRKWAWFRVYHFRVVAGHDAALIRRQPCALSALPGTG